MRGLKYVVLGSAVLAAGLIVFSLSNAIDADILGVAAIVVGTSLATYGLLTIKD